MQPALGDPASAGGVDWVTHRGPFQPRTFCDSVIYFRKRKAGEGNARDGAAQSRRLNFGSGMQCGHGGTLWTGVNVLPRLHSFKMGPVGMRFEAGNLQEPYPSQRSLSFCSALLEIPTFRWCGVLSWCLGQHPPRTRGHCPASPRRGPNQQSSQVSLQMLLSSSV